MEETRNLEETLGEVLLPEILVQKMLAYKEDCDGISSMIAFIQSKFRKAEEARKAYQFLAPTNCLSTAIILQCHFQFASQD